MANEPKLTRGMVGALNTAIHALEKAKGNCKSADIVRKIDKDVQIICKIRCLILYYLSNPSFDFESALLNCNEKFLKDVNDG